MNLFVSITHKLLFSEINIADTEENVFDKYVKIFNSGNHDFVHSMYKFMIINHYISNSETFKLFQDKTAIFGNSNLPDMNKWGEQRKYKFDFLKRNLENMFFQQADKEQLLYYFCKIQKHYFAFSRLLHIWKFKRAIMMVTNDLYMNELDASGENIFVIVQNGKKYMFSIANLINMVNTSLSNTSHFFASPIVLKNPYNNIVFNKSSLYNLYFAIKKSTFIMPVLFHYYFLSNFNIYEFRNEYEGIIRDVSIDNHIKNADYNVLYKQIFNMLKEHKSHLTIDEDFPKKDLVNILRPYLHLYYISLYSLDEYKKLNAFSELHKKLHKLYKFNPKFGRKIIQTSYNNKFRMKSMISYNDVHPDYNKPVAVDDFMKTHENTNYYDNQSDEDENTSESNNNIYGVFIFQTQQNELNTGGAMDISNDNETANEEISSDSDSDSHLYFGYRTSSENIVNEESEYQEILRNMVNEEPIVIANNNDVLYEEEYDESSSSSEDESDEIVIESESDNDSDLSDIDQ